MNILLAVHHFPPKYTGGAEWRAFRTAQHLLARGHQVRVVCIESIAEAHLKGIRFTDEIYQGIRVRRLFFNLRSSPDSFKWKYDNPWIAGQVSQMIQEERPDIFHLFSGYLITASALNAAHQARIKTILSATDFWFFCPLINLIKTNGKIDQNRFLPSRAQAIRCVQCIGEEKRRYRLPALLAPKIMQAFWKSQEKKILSMQDRIFFLQESLEKVDTIICPSNFLREYYLQAGLSMERIIFSRQGVDLTRIEPSGSRSVSSPLRIGYIGQIAYHKGVHILFEAVKKIPQANLKVEVYGNSGQFPKYTRQLNEIAGNDHRLHMAGTYPREEISSVFNHLDVLVMPSLWYENSPNVILEAFAFRLPVVASHLGGMSELIQDNENGFLFEVGNATDLARKLMRILEDPTLLEGMKSRIPPVKSVDEEIDELEDIYLRTVQSSGQIQTRH